MWMTKTASKEHHCSTPSTPGEAVEIGKGSRLEQLRPEHGLRGAFGSSGEWEPPSCEGDTEPAIKMLSSRRRSRNGSDFKPTG